MGVRLYVEFSSPAVLAEFLNVDIVDLLRYELFCENHETAIDYIVSHYPARKARNLCNVQYKKNWERQQQDPVLKTIAAWDECGLGRVLTDHLLDSCIGNAEGEEALEILEDQIREMYLRGRWNFSWDQYYFLRQKRNVVKVSWR